VRRDCSAVSWVERRAAVEGGGAAGSSLPASARDSVSVGRHARPPAWAHTTGGDPAGARRAGRRRTRRLEVPDELRRLPRARDLGLEEQLGRRQLALDLEFVLVRGELGLVRLEGGRVGAAQRGVEVLLRGARGGRQRRARAGARGGKGRTW